MTRHRHAGVHGVYTIPSRWTRAVLPSRPGRTRAGTKTKPSPQGLFAVYVRGRRAQPHSSHSSHCRSKARTHLLQLWRRARGRRLGLAFVLAVLGLLLLIALVPLLLLLLRSPPPPSRRSQARPRRPLPCLSVTTWLADRQSPPSHCTCDGLLLRLRPFPPPRAGVSDDTATIDGPDYLVFLVSFFLLSCGRPPPTYARQASPYLPAGGAVSDVPPPPELPDLPASCSSHGGHRCTRRPRYITREGMPRPFPAHPSRVIHWAGGRSAFAGRGGTSAAPSPSSPSSPSFPCHLRRPSQRHPTWSPPLFGDTGSSLGCPSPP